MSVAKLDDDAFSDLYICLFVCLHSTLCSKLLGIPLHWGITLCHATSTTAPLHRTLNHWHPVVSSPFHWFSDFNYPVSVIITLMRQTFATNLLAVMTTTWLGLTLLDSVCIALAFVDNLFSYHSGVHALVCLILVSPLISFLNHFASMISLSCCPFLWEPTV